MLGNILAFGSNHVGWEIQPSRNFFYKKPTGKLTASHVKFSSTFRRVACNFNPVAVLDMEPFLFLLAQNVGTQCLPFKAGGAHSSWCLEMQVFSWAARPCMGLEERPEGSTLCDLSFCVHRPWQRPSLPKPGPPGASISRSLGATD